jgi:hypothetical protein
MVQTALVGSVLFGAVLVATVAYLSRRGWRTYSPAPATGSDGPGGGAAVLERAVDDPAVWTVAFLLAVAAAGLTTVAFVGSGLGLPEGANAVAGGLLVAGAVAVLAGYLTYGTFVSARNRGLANSQAAALGAWALGLAAIVVIVLKIAGLF